MVADSEPKWTFAQKFYTDFNVTASELTSRLDALKSGRDVPQATIQDIASDLSLLSKSLSDATGSLPSYDQRQCELQLKTLEKGIEELRGASAGTHKFSFKRKETKPKPSTERAPVAGPPPAKSQSNPSDSETSLHAFSHQYLTALDIRTLSASGEVSISDLDNCIVNLLPNDKEYTRITAFHVRRVSRSVILLPQVAGSIILHDLSLSVIVVGCHQFRMHNSTLVDVYLESGSDPIIEHCLGIRFATYPSDIVSGGVVRDNKHFTVKDFSHILPTPSPHWSSLSQERHEKSWPTSLLQDEELEKELERMLPAQPSLSENGFQK